MVEQSAIRGYQIRVIGRVQGVGFRYYTMSKANELGIKGFVRNEPDGSVWMEAEGKDVFLTEFISWCHQGPRFARVDLVEVNKTEVKNYTDFRIR